MSSIKEIGERLGGALVYKYAIDVFSSTLINGWCVHRFDRDRPLMLGFFSGGKLLGECPVDIKRADLKKPSLHPTGACGFSFTIPGQPETEASFRSDEIVISVKGSGTVLCVLNKVRPDKVSGNPAHPFSRFKRLLLPKGRKFNRVFFMHIPKTAGTTLNTFANRVYPFSKAIAHIEFYEPGEYVGIARDYLFISGHLNVGQIRRYFSDHPYSYCTLVREPYAQFHSHLNWLRGIAADRESAFYQSHHELFKNIADDISRKERLSYDELQHIVENLDGVLRKLLDNNETRYFLSEECEKVEPQHLEEALENLEMFDLIGTTEHFEQFKTSFCEVHNIEIIESNRTLNRAHYGALYDIKDARNREILLPLVEKDLALYQRVESLEKGQKV